MIPCARGNGIQNDGNIRVMPDRQRSFWIPVPASPCAHWNRIQNHDVIYCQSCRSTSDAHWICRCPLEESDRALFLDQICCAKGTETGHVIGRETQQLAGRRARQQRCPRGLTSRQPTATPQDIELCPAFCPPRLSPRSRGQQVGLPSKSPRKWLRKSNHPRL